MIEQDLNDERTRTTNFISEQNQPSGTSQIAYLKIKNMIATIDKRYVLKSVYLILFLALVPSVVFAEAEINTTLEDNLIILLDYSGSTLTFREYIQSNALYSIQNIAPESNASVVFFGGFIKSSNFTLWTLWRTKISLKILFLMLQEKSVTLPTITLRRDLMKQEEYYITPPVRNR